MEGTTYWILLGIGLYWMYCILVEDEFGMSRDDLMRRLEEKGIETRSFFYPMHVMPPYKNNERFLIAKEISRKGINLPSGIKLSKGETREICENIKDIVRRQK